MDPFSYLSFLTSIVLALGITRLLTGWGTVLQFRGQLKMYGVHLVWTLNLFLYLVLIWWILYRWNGLRDWNFFLFVFVLLAPTVAFLESVLLFPDRINENTDLKQHFYSNARSFFLLAALLAPLDAVDTALKGWDHFLAQGIIYPIFLSMIFGLSLVAAFTRRESYHIFYAGFFSLYLLLFITVNLRTLA